MCALVCVCVLRLSGDFWNGVRMLEVAVFFFTARYALTLSRSSNASHEKRVFRWKKCLQHVAIKRDTQKEQTKLQLLIKCVYISVWCF